MTGNLWYSLDGYPGYFLAAGFDPSFRTIFPFWYWPDEPAAQSQGQNEAEKRKRYEEALAQVRSMNHRFFHLPSKTWLDVPEEIKGSSFQEVPSSHDGSVRWYASISSLTKSVDVLETDPKGKTRIVAASIKVGGDFEENLIAYSSQIAFHRPPKQRLPDWLQEQVGKIKFFNDWLKEEWDEIHVFDYENDRDLWKLEVPRYDFISLEATANHSALIINRLANDHYEIAVLALPLPSYSPWWSRAAGLIVFVFCLLLLRQLKPTPKAVPHA
jgi:hypothetical protein